jgi:hypothetical protein
VKWSAAIQAKRNFEVSADAERVAEPARTTDANVDRTRLDLLLAAENLREAEINLALKQAETVQALVTLPRL